MLMPRALRVALLVAGGAVALVVLVFVAAFALMPRGTIEKEAQRIASNASGSSIAWTKLSPGFSNWALGVRVHGLAMRSPATGPARMNARFEEVFVQFKLFPLLLRRVEIAAARVKGGGIAMTDLGPDSSAAKSPGRPSGMSLVLPRLDVENVAFRSRDALGGGVDLRGLRGKAEIAGTLQAPRSVRIAMAADSLFWKPSARDSIVPLPSPIDVSVALVGKDGGKRLEVTEGRAELGPFSSGVTGGILLPPAPEEPVLALVITGTPQAVGSSDPAIRPLLGRSPAVWKATVSWEVKVDGPLSAPTQTGRALVEPLTMTAQFNSFDLEHASAAWTSRADRTFAARTEGFGGGLAFTADATGSTTPGGTIQGTFSVHGPAERLNGLLPNTPTWSGGSIEASGSFTLRPPMEPDVQWTVIGTDLKGTVPNVSRPVRKLNFDVRGDAAGVTVKSFAAIVGSTTASATGRVLSGKPLGTGTFQVTVDRLVAEEWAPPAGDEVALPPVPAPGAAAAPPPIPLRSFDASVRVGEVRTGSLTVRDMVIPVRFDRGNLAAQPIKGSIGTGSLEGALALTDFGAAKQKFNLHLDVKRAPVEEMAGGLLPIRLGLSGLVSGIVDLSGPGLPGPAVGDSLRGAMSGTVENGAFKQSPVIKSLGSALGLDGVQSAQFKTLTHSFRIAGGRLILDRMKGDVGKDLVEMAGSLGFDQSLDMNLVIRLAPNGCAAAPRRRSSGASRRTPRAAFRWTSSSPARPCSRRFP